MNLVQKIIEPAVQTVKADAIPITGFFVGVFADVRDAASLILIVLSIFAVALRIYATGQTIKKNNKEE